MGPGQMRSVDLKSLELLALSVTSCPFGPNAVGLQYGLHGLGWSQRLSVISRIKGAEWPAFQKFASLANLVGSEMSRCTGFNIPAWLIPTPPVSLGRSVVAQHTGGSGAFVSAKRKEDG